MPRPKRPSIRCSAPNSRPRWRNWKPKEAIAAARVSAPLRDASRLRNNLHRRIPRPLHSGRGIFVSSEPSSDGDRRGGFQTRRPRPGRYRGTRPYNVRKDSNSKRVCSTCLRKRCEKSGRRVTYFVCRASHLSESGCGVHPTFEVFTSVSPQRGPGCVFRFCIRQSLIESRK